MPDPITGVVAAGAGATVYGADKAAGATREATRASVAGQESSIAAQEAARRDVQQRLEPFRKLGLGALEPFEQTLDDENRLLQLRERHLRGLEGNTNQASIKYHEDSLSDIDQRLSAVRDLPARPDLEALPQVGVNLPGRPQAFDPAAIADNPIYDFLLEEGFRGIEERAAGAGRNPDRDLVRFAQGTAASLLPQLQQQQFSQQAGLRQQTLAEQMGLRGQALAEQSGLRQDALAENQQRVNNLLSALGIGQASAANQGAAGIQTANQISSALGNIGTAQAQGALGQSAIQNQALGNILGLTGTLVGANQGLQAGFRPTVQGQPLAGPLNAGGFF